MEPNPIRVLGSRVVRVLGSRVGGQPALVERGRRHWARMRSPWPKVRAFVGFYVMGIAFLVVVWGVTHPARLGPAAWVGVTMVGLAIAWSVRLRGRIAADRPMGAAVEQVTVPASSSAPTAAAALEQPLSIAQHPNWRVVIGVNIVKLCGPTSQLDQCRAALRRIPWACRLLLSACLTERPDSDRLPRGARLLVARTWLRPLWPEQAVRALVTLEGAESVLHMRGRYNQSFEIGRRIWRVRRAPFIAVNCGCSLTRLGRTDEAIAWIGRAIAHGYPPDPLLADPDLAGLLGDPRFTALVTSAGAKPEPAVLAVKSEPGDPVPGSEDFGPYLTR